MGFILILPIVLILQIIAYTTMDRMDSKSIIPHLICLQIITDTIIVGMVFTSHLVIILTLQVATLAIESMLFCRKHFTYRSN